MKRKIFTTLVLACSFIVCFAAIDLSGNWKGVIHIADGSEYPLNYTFKVDGNKLSGNLESTVGNIPITDGIVKGDSIIFDVRYDGGDIPNRGKCYADSIGMNIIVQGVTYHITLNHTAQ